MELKPMRSTAKTRKEFERNFHLLAEHIRNRRMRFMRGVSTDGIERVRYLPNRRVDFLSVNESARLAANSIADMDNLPEFKIKRDSDDEK